MAIPFNLVGYAQFYHTSFGILLMPITFIAVHCRLKECDIRLPVSKQTESTLTENIDFADILSWYSNSHYYRLVRIYISRAEEKCENVNTS